MTRSRLLGLLAVAGAAILLWLAVDGWLEARSLRDYAQERSSRAAATVDTLAPLDARLRESSGLAVSRAHPGILWTQNDSGDEPRFYAMDMSGRVRATFDVVGAQAVDWEALDLGPCPGAPSDPCVYLGDIGDNVRTRDVVTVYVVREPDPAGGDGVAPLVGRLRYSYPDTTHDAEALAVSAAGDLVVVTKGRTPDIRLYRLDPEAVRAAVAADSTVTLPEGTVLPIAPSWILGRVVTGAGFSPDGDRLAVRTYSEIFFFAWPLSGTPATVLSSCYLGDLEPQGEAVAFETPDAVLLTSETARGRQGNLLRVTCPG